MVARIGTSYLIYHHNDPFSNNASLMFSTNKLKVISTKVQNNLLKDTEIVIRILSLLRRSK